MTLFDAVKAGDIEKVKLCLGDGKLQIYFFFVTDDDDDFYSNDYNSALHLAASFDIKNQILELFLSQTKVDVNICFTAEQTNDYIEWTPLHDACHGKATKNIKTLLAHGANILAKNGKGKTPKQLAIDNYASKELLQLLNNAQKV